MLVWIAVILLLGHQRANLRGGSDRSGATGELASWRASSLRVVAALLGVAGGELLIPTLVLLFGADIKLAGSLSLAVSLPTMLVGFARYSQDRELCGSRSKSRFRVGHGSWLNRWELRRQSTALASFRRPHCCPY